MAEEPKSTDRPRDRAPTKSVPPREASAAERVRAADFPTAMRGYDREAVDAFVDQVAELIDTLESRQARETVVQRALEEVGEETSAILKQAHESADDITARSRSKAEDRVEVARQEAAVITREAQQEAAELKRETEDLQDERANLIEDLRRTAGEILAVAKAAADRLEETPPEGVVAAPPEEPYDGVADLDPGDLQPGDVEPGDLQPGGLEPEAVEPDAVAPEDVEPEDLEPEDVEPVEGWADEEPDQPTDELEVPAGEQLEDEPPR